MRIFKTTLLTIALILCSVGIAFGVGTWTYDESLNKIVVTGGTSGTPAAFSDFVTADRAGIAELTPEDAPVACTTNITLTYQIRPVEDCALQITFTLVGTSAGAGDTLDITGTDWRNAAQSESIDVSGGDAAYTGAKYWRTITDIDCTGWADGTLKVTQPQWGVIWDYGNRQYQIDATVWFGNGSTTTYFESLREQVFWNAVIFQVRSNAQLSIGDLLNAYPTAGSFWRLIGYGSLHDISSGTLLIYDSMLEISPGAEYVGIYFNSTTTIKNCIFFSNVANTVFYAANANNVIDDLWVDRMRMIFISVAPSTSPKNIRITNSDYGLQANVNLTTSGVTIPNAIDAYLSSDGAYTFNVIDVTIGAETISISNAAGIINKQYTCNIHVADKDGGAIADTATVLCTRANVVTESAKFYKCTTAHTSGTFATDLAAGKWEEITDVTILAAAPAWLTSTAYVSAEQEFSVNPTSGAIAEQTITYKKWTGTSELETKYIHTFMLSESGYKTLVINDKEVTVPIVWHKELQSITMPPAPFFGDLKADDYYFAEVVNE